MANIGFISLASCLIGLTVCMESAFAQFQPLQTVLSERQYHRRIVLLYSRSDASQALFDQQKMLTDAQAELNDRQMDVIVLISSELPKSDYQFLVHQPFYLNQTSTFQGWLIGKDGGVKTRFNRPIDPKELFRLVDAMPMRQQEIKNR